MYTGQQRNTDVSRADVELSGITKTFDGDIPVVDGVSLTIAPGELVSILGPSGCGKTTTLRIIAGFVDPDAGRILLKNSDVTKLPPHKRDVGMLFQNYALFPHLTVLDNVSFGLKMRRISRQERYFKSEQALELVRLREYAHRYPSQLSGGQQQRVALARAIVIRPSVLLLDEPLSNLDARLRQELRGQIRELQQHLDITTIFVTHDQEEALTVSDRVVVMNRGRIEQIGAPADIYRFPQTLFVTEFMGETNILPGRIERTNAEYAVFAAGSGSALEVLVKPDSRDASPKAISIRPETIKVFRGDDPLVQCYPNRFAATVEAANFLGPSSMLRVAISQTVMLKVMQVTRGVGDDAGDYVPKVGERVLVAWQPEWCQIIPE